jgi:hypothetical protein
MDHITTCSRLIETSREYQLPLIFTFINYEKAFDSVEPIAVLNALDEQGVEAEYVDLLGKCYVGCTVTLRPFHRKVLIPIEKGVLQGDSISANLFSAVLNSTIRRCEWDDTGLQINGRRLNHLRFADDIVLITPTPEEATRMLQSLVEEGIPAGLKINTAKTKVMRNRFAGTTPVELDGNELEEVDKFVYLGRELNMANDLLPEISRRRRAAWAAFGNIKAVTDASRDSRLKAELFNSTVLPALCYGCETWGMNSIAEKKLRTAQASIERRMLNMTLYQQRERQLHNTDIREMTKVKDAVQHADEAKHRWAGHIMRRTDGRWTREVHEWYPRSKKRPRGRPPIRWADSLDFRNTERDNARKIVRHWSTKAQDRDEWKRSWDSRCANRRN